MSTELTRYYIYTIDKPQNNYITVRLVHNLRSRVVRGTTPDSDYSVFAVGTLGVGVSVRSGSSATVHTIPGPNGKELPKCTPKNRTIDRQSDQNYE